MDGREIVEKLRVRKQWSGSVGAIFLLSNDADNLLAYIEGLENLVTRQTGRSSGDKKLDTDTRPVSQ